MILEVNVKNKIPSTSTDYRIVCGNSDYVISFTFDEEWNEYVVKTARFSYVTKGEEKYQDVVFEGNECAVPVLSDTSMVKIGVFAGDLHTTTPCIVMCDKSIICGDGIPEEPPENVYAQILEKCNDAVMKSEEAINIATNSGGTGTDGKDGVSPTVEVTETTNGHNVSITDVNGTKSFEVQNGKDGEDGYTPQKNVDYFDGKDGSDGQDGYTPQKGVDYFDGKDGADGKTPVKGVDYFDGVDGKDGVSVTHSWNGTILSVTSASGTSSKDLKGDPGAIGSNGKDGTSVTVKSVSESTVDGGLNVITFSDGKTVTIKNGSKGSTGVSGTNGNDGYTPIKGVDYYTEEDKAEIVDELKNSAPVKSVNGKTGAVSLSADDVGARPSTWTPTYTDVGADKSGTANSVVGTHNTNTDAHNDIRLLILGLSSRLDALANSDDTTLDQMAEVVAYIKANRDLIEQITTGKVSVADIVDNLTTNVSNKPLSASQGVALKKLIDAIVVPTKLADLSGDTTHRTVTDTEKSTWNAKSDFSGAYGDLTGKPTIPTVPTKVSAFENDKGYLTEHQSLSGYATETYVKNYAQPKGNYLTSHQDISGKADKSSAETWTFTLKDGSTVTKKVVLA